MAKGKNSNAATSEAAETEKPTGSVAVTIGRLLGARDALIKARDFVFPKAEDNIAVALAVQQCGPFIDASLREAQKFNNDLVRQTKLLEVKVNVPITPFAYETMKPVGFSGGELLRLNGWFIHGVPGLLDDDEVELATEAAAKLFGAKPIVH